MNIQRPAILFIMVFMSSACLAETSQSLNINAITGAKTWEINAHGVSFSLTQILPDQARAFYVNRGFNTQQIEEYATSCVYMTVLRNDNAPGSIHFIRNTWSIVSGEKTRTPVSVSKWMQKLKDKKVKKSALIGFRWAQFPPEQEYEPGGDWNQGMMTIDLPAGRYFDFIARWDINGKPYETKLQGVQCAK